MRTTIHGTAPATHGSSILNSINPHKSSHLILTLALILPLSVGAFVSDHLTLLKETKRCPRCDLKGADLEKAILENAYLNKANLQGANLRSADLRGEICWGLI